LLSSEEPVEEGGAGVADVEMAGRGWSETYADSLGHEKMLANGGLSKFKSITTEGRENTEVFTEEN